MTQPSKDMNIWKLLQLIPEPLHMPLTFSLPQFSPLYNNVTYSKDKSR